VLLPRESLVAEQPSGALRPWPPVFVTCGPGVDTRLHAHHCWHVIEPESETGDRLNAATSSDPLTVLEDGIAAA